MLVPIAALTVVQPAAATVFMSIQQAQALMFPGATLTEEFRSLTDAQVAAIEKASDANVASKQFKVWRASTGGWFIADQVVGKHDFIPFAVALDANGAVKDVEILEYREGLRRRNRQRAVARAIYREDSRLHPEIDQRHSEFIRRDAVLQTHYGRCASIGCDPCNPLRRSLNAASRCSARSCASGLRSISVVRGRCFEADASQSWRKFTG